MDIQNIDKQYNGLKNESKNIIRQVFDDIQKTKSETTNKRLKEINTEVQDLYKKINPKNGGLFGKITGFYKEQKISHNLGDIKGEIEKLFTSLNESYNHLYDSVEQKKKLLESVKLTKQKCEEYLNNLNNNISDCSEREQQRILIIIKNGEALLAGLEAAEKRCEIRIDTGEKLLYTIKMSLPIFEVLLSVNLLEGHGQRQIEDSQRTLDVFAKSIENMNTNLSERAIESNKKINNDLKNGIMDTEKMKKDLDNLKNYLKEMEEQRKELYDSNYKIDETENFVPGMLET